MTTKMNAKLIICLASFASVVLCGCGEKPPEEADALAPKSNNPNPAMQSSVQSAAVGGQADGMRPQR